MRDRKPELGKKPDGEADGDAKPVAPTTIPRWDDFFDAPGADLGERTQPALPKCDGLTTNP
jgi:hypothetical protein